MLKKLLRKLLFIIGGIFCGLLASSIMAILFGAIGSVGIGISKGEMPSFTDFRFGAGMAFAMFGTLCSFAGAIFGGLASEQ